MARTPDPKSARAIELLGHGSTVAFLRAIREESVLAAQLVNDRLDERESLADLFLSGEEFGFYLYARSLGSRKFKVGFGCVAGPEEGDGGEWTVTFTEDGAISEIRGETSLTF